jgi:hypothetical protein
MVVGLIEDIVSCEELLTRMVRDCRAHLTASLRMMEVD